MRGRPGGPGAGRPGRGGRGRRDGNGGRPGRQRCRAGRGGRGGGGRRCRDGRTASPGRHRRRRRGGRRSRGGLRGRRGERRRGGRRRRSGRARCLAGVELQHQGGDADQRAGAGDDAVERALAEELLHRAGADPRWRQRRRLRRRAFAAVARSGRPFPLRRLGGAGGHRPGGRRLDRWIAEREQRVVGNGDLARAVVADEGLVHQIARRRQLERLRRIDVAHQRPELPVILRSALGLDRHRRVDRGEEALAVQAGGDDRERTHRILGEPVGRRGRGAAGDRGVDHRRQRIQVGPSAALGFGGAAVLLDRGEAGLERCGRRVLEGGDRLLRATKAEQDRADRRQDDVVGTDVLVPDAAVVQQRDDIEHRLQPGAQFGFPGHVVELGERGLERRPFVERHHHVGGAVLLPEAVHLDQRGMIEARQQPRLGDEALQAGLVAIQMAFRDHGHRGRAGGPGGHRDRQVFPDGDPAVQDRVPGAVDDSEGSLADHVGELVLAQPRTPRQRPAGGRPCAGRAYPVVDRVCRIHCCVCACSCRRVPATSSRRRTADRRRAERGCDCRAWDSAAARKGQGHDELSHAIHGGGSPGLRRRKKPKPSMLSTTWPCWLRTSLRLLTSPTSGRLARGRDSRTVFRMLRTSPG